jgi:hypothetical protein
MDDKNLNKIRNLLSFNINLNRHCDVGPLVKQSPDYILEKYNHWIGIEPITDYPNYTPDNLTPFFNQYHKIWKSDIYSIKRHLLYLKETENLNVLKMVNSFEKYFAPIEMISDEKKVGLHYINYKFSEEILRGNKENIKIFLRDMRLKELLK